MALTIKKEKEIGLALTEDELVELKFMYCSGRYHLTEIAEWFGLTPYKVKKYLEMEELL